MAPRKKPAPPLTEWESWSHFLALLAATAHVRGVRPASVLLVGRPSMGKSALLARLNWRGLYGVSDVTAAGLKDLLASDPRVRLLVMPELQRLFGHHPATVDTLMSLLLSVLTGEGGRELVGPEEKGMRTHLGGRCIGLFTAVPWDVLRLRAKDFGASGLLSRFALLSIHRSEAERARIRRNIIYGDRTDLKPYPPPRVLPETPDGTVAVSTTPDVDRELEKWLDDAAPQADERRVGLCTALLRAVAFLDGRDRVRAADVGELRAFAGHLFSVSYELGTLTPTEEVLPLRRPPVWAR